MPTGISALLERLGLAEDSRCSLAGPRALTDLVCENPATGQPLAHLRLDARSDLERVISRAQAVQRSWQLVPAPRRGEVVRRIGLALRAHQEDLGRLIALEVGKIRAEGVGEVVEAIDMADFSVGLSRQLYGLTMHSERPRHRMYEQWHPLGVVGIVTAFNFPIAVWAWNALLAAVCGNATIWKPSLLAPLTAMATTRLVREVLSQQDVFRPEQGSPADLFGLVIGTDEEVSENLVADRRLPLISATGSCRMGRRVGEVVARRLGRCLLELGGNNAVIVLPDADLDLAERALLFGAVGTAGQRCTSTRRLLCHAEVAGALLPRLLRAWKSVPIGDPLLEGTLMGPLISSQAVAGMRRSLEAAEKAGAEVLCGGIAGIERMSGRGGHFVEPTLVRVPPGPTPAIVREETFAPILWIQVVSSLEEAIERGNEVSQGLSSALFTDSVRAAEQFLSPAGSDCGIANVNIGTSGAEIGGAFGGEKDTGGGREAGSDSWKAYMRRQTCTLNWGGDLPLAQGIRFGGGDEG